MIKESGGDLMNGVDYLEQFRHYLEALGRSPVTINGYRCDVHHFMRWYEQNRDGDFRVDQLANGLVRAYRQQLIEDGAQPNTVNRRMAALAAFAHWAREAGYLDHNPVQGIGAMSEVKVAPHWLDRRDQAALLRAMEKEVAHARLNLPRLQFQVIRDAAILVLLLNTGLRIGEAAVLTNNDVLLDERKGKVIVREGKGEKRREVPLNAETRRWLQQYLDERPDDGSEMFFIGKNGGVTIRTMRRGVVRFAKLAGLDGVSPHTLRHTFAKNLIDSGVSLEKVAVLLGHSSLDTTMIYTTPGERDLEEAVNGLSQPCAK
jgi:site-specific recombinase XerD